MLTGTAAGEAVRYERVNAAAVVTIDRQHRRNAIDGPTAEALHEAFLRFEDEADALTLVLTGAGEHAFCAGADLKAIDTFAERLDRQEGPLGFTRLAPSKPTIAAIGGWCLAGGLELALWCDLRIAGQDAKLGFTERRFGVPLIDGGTQRLPRLIGLSRALHLILTGGVLDATEAQQIGLVNEIVPSGEHLKRALTLADALARFPREALLHDRNAAIAGASLSLADGLRLEAESGPATFAQARVGAASFQAGAGRGGAGV